MKKEYIKPEILEDVLLPERLMVTVVSGGDSATNEPKDDLSNGRRGRWGNLWDEE